ncbi:MAG: M23 family metallopeptidase [Negativicutes bacterium]|nr:M23 family metallopeptidase [Negativicutes bacterium]
MPDRSQTVFLWLKEIGKLGRQSRSRVPLAVYAATAMTVVVAGLLLTVAGGVKHSAREVPGTQVGQPESAALTAAGGRQDSPGAKAVAVPAADKRSDQTQSVIAQQPPVYRDDAPQQPVAGEIALGFGWREHPVFHDWRYHPGVDIGAPVNTPVKALYGGEVTAVYEDRNYGLTVVIQSETHVTYYGSLAATTLEKGQQIAAGGKVGLVGSSQGESSYHLHLAIKKGDKYIDPGPILSKAE